MPTKPDWAYWRSRLTAELWQCVELSLDCEPRQESLASNGSQLSKRLAVAAELSKRLDVALDHTKHGALHLIGISPRIPQHRRPVRLSEFAAWAVGMKWTMPHELATMAQADEPAGETVAPALPESAQELAKAPSEKPAAALPEAATAPGLQPTADWQALAKNEARKFIEQQAANGCFPSQEAIAQQIAEAFRLRKPPIHGADGKPLSAGTIKRHALKGISSATKTARATRMNRGK